MSGSWTSDVPPASGQAAVQADPFYEVMLEEAARDAAALRQQMNQVRLISGAVLVTIGLVTALGTVVSFATTLRVAGGVPGGVGLSLGFLGVALLFALLLFGFGLWLAFHAMSDD